MKIDITCFKLIVFVAYVFECLSLESSLMTEANSGSTIFESIAKYKNKFTKPAIESTPSQLKKDIKPIANTKSVSPVTNFIKSPQQDKTPANFMFAQKEGATSQVQSKSQTQAKTKAGSKAINDVMNVSTVDSRDQTGKNYNLLSTVNSDNRERYDSKEQKIGQVFWNGWIKYYTYTNVDEKTILTGFNKTAPFYKNNYYNAQAKANPGINVTEIEDDDYKWIKDESSFYLSLFDGIISISNSRENKEQTVYDSIPIHKISQIIEQPGYNGGLKIINMVRNQNCFLLSSDKLNSKWTICLDQPDKMMQLMNNIKQEVITHQRQNGLIVINNNVNLKKQNDKLYKKIGEQKEQDKLMKEFGKKNDEDSYWILMQTWSSCNLACGGGTQSLQRLCVKPKPTSPECKGSALLERKCNEQPCPGIIQLQKKEKEQKAVANPIVKVMQFSNRPQQYIVRKYFNN